VSSEVRKWKKLKIQSAKLIQNSKLKIDKKILE